MRATLADARPQVRLAPWWPAALHPDVLAEMTLPTPYLLTDLDTIRDRYAQLRSALPEADVFYAVKCNPSHGVIDALHGVGAGFEVASAGELDLLRRRGVAPQDVLYSNTIKPAAHIAAAHDAGLWRFAFDSEGELHKLARHAPGAAVTVRVRVDDSMSIFPLSRKFGAEAHQARALLLLARSLGLRPYGVTFHVGSQCTTPLAWRQAIASAGRLLERLADDGVTLEMLDLGGGFPARYVDGVPPLEQITTIIRRSLDELLPYRPQVLAVEPGRFLVGEAAVMVASVLGRELRAGEEWLYLDVGAYNGLMETQQTVGQWQFPLWTSRVDHAAITHVPFTVTGPSCDSSDTVFYGAALPNTIGIDDRVYIGSTGAYTMSYASHFNGFPPPTCHYVGTW